MKLLIITVNIRRIVFNYNENEMRKTNEKCYKFTIKVEIYKAGVLLQQNFSMNVLFCILL